MRQIASEYYIKNTFNITGVTSNGDNYCPTYQEIISTSKIGVNGTYSNNQLVCQEDLFSMSNYVTIYLINQSCHELINVYIAANGNGYLDISSDHTAGSLKNLADGDEGRIVFDKGSDSDNTYMIGYEYSMFEGESITEPLWIGFSENSKDVEFEHDGDGYVATINYNNKELYIQAPSLVLEEKEITITYYTFVNDNTSNISIPLKVVFDNNQATSMVMALTDKYWDEQITRHFSIYEKDKYNIKISNYGPVVCNTSSNMYLNVCDDKGVIYRDNISNGDSINIDTPMRITGNLTIVVSDNQNDYVNSTRGKLFLFMYDTGEDWGGEYHLELTSSYLSRVSGKSFSKADFEEYSIGRILFPEYSYDMLNDYTPCVITYTSNLIAGDYYMVVNDYDYKYTLTEANINAINNGENVYIDNVEPNGEVYWH